MDSFSYNKLDNLPHGLDSDYYDMREFATKIIRFIQAVDPDCALCPYYNECWSDKATKHSSPMGCLIYNKARELGIEVDR